MALRNTEAGGKSVYATPTDFTRLQTSRKEEISIKERKQRLNTLIEVLKKDPTEDNQKMFLQAACSFFLNCEADLDKPTLELINLLEKNQELLIRSYQSWHQLNRLDERDRNIESQRIVLTVYKGTEEQKYSSIMFVRNNGYIEARLPFEFMLGVDDIFSNVSVDHKYASEMKEVFGGDYALRFQS